MPQPVTAVHLERPEREQYSKLFESTVSHRVLEPFLGSDIESVHTLREEGSAAKRSQAANRAVEFDSEMN